MPTLPPAAFEKALVLLSGDEEVLRRRALQELLEGVDDCERESFLAGDGDARAWIGTAGTLPFLSDRRTVVVRNLLRAGSPEEALGEAVTGLKSLPPTARLVLVVDEETGDESKQRRLLTVRKKWEDTVKKSGGHVALFSTAPDQVKTQIREDATRLGHKMSPAAATVLAEMCGGSLSRALEELEKLSLHAGPGQEIRESDVRELAVPSREWNVYKLTEAVFQGRVDEAFTQLRTLVSSPTKAEDAAFSRIFPTLSRQLRMYWQARVCLDAKVSPADPPPSVLSQFPEKALLKDEADWKRGQIVASAERVRLAQIAACLQALADADARLKGALPGVTAMDTLERMIIEMVEVVGSARKARR